MKAKLLLDLDDPEQKKELERCLKSFDYLIALDEIRNEIFRPARKHGYPDKKLNDLLEGNVEKTEEYQKALEELNNAVSIIEEHGTEEQKAYSNNLQQKLMEAEYSKETSFSQAIDLLEDKFWEILRDRNIDINDI